MLILILLVLCCVVAILVWFWLLQTSRPHSLFLSPLVDTKFITPPLQKFSIPELNSYTFKTSQITIGEQLWQDEKLVAHLFTFQTMGKTMSGQLIVGKEWLQANNSQLDNLSTQDIPTIILVRGYVPLEIYQPGVGTQNAAKVFASNGYLTLAPDFFGYGQSDPEPIDTWEARFIKPVNLYELILSVQNEPIKLTNTTLQPNKVGIWAHSNGGQIALTMLAGTGSKYPTTLWAPVTAPFPYSVLFFTNESEDEGKALRKSLAKLEAEYDVFDFTISKHIDKIMAPLQLHQGTADIAVPSSWSDAFAQLISAQNKVRQLQLEDERASLSSASTTTNSVSPTTSPIPFTYFNYVGADHNLQPNDNWSNAISRDIDFMNSYLK